MASAIFEMARRLWQRLPILLHRRDRDTWPVGDGPGHTPRARPQDRMQALVIRVGVVERAKAFLRDNRLLGAEIEGQVTIESLEDWGP